MNIPNNLKTFTETQCEAIGCAADYFYAAIESIDTKFGKDYAKQHPELIGAYMNCIAQEYSSGANTNCVADLRDAILELASNLGYISQSIDDKEL